MITHDFALLCRAVQEVFSETMETEQKERLKKLISRVHEFNQLRVKGGARVLGGVRRGRFASTRLPPEPEGGYAIENGGTSGTTSRTDDQGHRRTADNFRWRD